MLEYARKICNPREICRVCPLVKLCREIVPITKAALTDWETRIEAKAKELCEVNMKNEPKEDIVTTVSFIDAITQINSKRRSL